MNDRIQLKRGTLANWLKVDPILMDGEMALVATDASKPTVYDSKKVGDGIHKFSELEMLGYECLQELGDSQQFPLSQKAITDWINEGYQFRGIATPSTNPGTPDGPVFYFATEVGTYANFNGISVADGEAIILLWNNGAWTKKVTGFSTRQQVARLDETYNEIKEKQAELAPAKSVSFISNSEFIFAIIDDNKNILWGKRRDNYTVDFGDSLIKEIVENLNNTVQQISVIVNDIENTYPKISNSVSFITNNEFIFAITDNSGSVLWGKRWDNSTYDSGDIPSNINSAIKSLSNNVTDILSELEGYNSSIVSLGNNISEVKKSVQNNTTSIASLSERIDAIGELTIEAKDKGYFTSEEALFSAYPTPKKGDYVNVSGIRYVCNIDGEWVNTEEQIGEGSINLEEYVKKEQLSCEINGLKYGYSYNTPTQDVIIEVNSSNDLSSVVDKIKEKLSSNSDLSIKVVLRGGEIYFKDRTIDLSSLNYPNASISFLSKAGEKCILIPEGHTYTPDDALYISGNHYVCNLHSSYTNDSGFVDLNKEEIVLVQDSGNINSKRVNKAESQVTESSTGICKFKLPEELSFLKNKSKDDMKRCTLSLDSWYVNYVYFSDLYTDDEFLYFPDTNVPNGDYSFSGRYANFYITNPPDYPSNLLESDKIYINQDKIFIPLNIGRLHQCNNCNLLYATRSTYLNNISLYNITFLGSNKLNNRTLEVQSNSSLNIVGLKFIAVSNCMYTYVTKESIIKECFVKDTYRQGIQSLTDTTSYILNNYVRNTSILVKQSRGITGAAIATNGKIKAEYNTVVNTPYCALQITKSTNKDSGGNIIPSIGEAIMVHNVLYNEEEYMRYVDRNSLMDGGAIYFGRGFGTTKVIANVIHHYWSKKSDSYYGIFVDDGQSNFTIKNNLIWACKGATIHARTLAHSELPGNKNNLNNYIGYNVLFGGYHFGGNGTEGYGVGSEYECISESNFICKDMSTSFTQSEFKNINIKKLDKKVSDSFIIGNTAFVNGLNGTITDEFILKYLYEIK